MLLLTDTNDTLATDAATTVDARAVKRVIWEFTPEEKRAGQRMGGGLHAPAPVPECFVTFRKHPTLSRWYVGPIPHAVARILDGRTINIAGTNVTFDLWPLVTSAGGSNTFDLDDVEAAFGLAPEQEETGE